MSDGRKIAGYVALSVAFKMAVAILLLGGTLAALALFGRAEAQSTPAGSLPRGVAALASALRDTGTVTTDLTVPPGARGVVVHVNVTTENGTDTMRVKLQRRDPLSGTWSDIAGASLASITATGHRVLVVAPGITAADSLRVNDVLSATVRISQVSTGTSTPRFTYSVGVVWLP